MSEKYEHPLDPALEPDPMVLDLRAQLAAMTVAKEKAEAACAALVNAPSVSVQRRLAAQMGIDAIAKPILDELAALKAEIARLRGIVERSLNSLQAIGSLPDGYCFCFGQEWLRHGHKGGRHTGECIEATKAIEAALAAQEASK